MLFLVVVLDRKMERITSGKLSLLDQSYLMSGDLVHSLVMDTFFCLFVVNSDKSDMRNISGPTEKLH